MTRPDGSDPSESVLGRLEWRPLQDLNQSPVGETSNKEAKVSSLKVSFNSKLSKARKICH